MSLHRSLKRTVGRDPARGRVLRTAAAALLLAGLAGCASAPRATPLTPEQVQLNVESFDTVWTTIRDRHFDPGLNGVDWELARTEIRPRVEQAETMSAARQAMQEMIGRLKQTHFGIIPAESYAAVQPEDPAADDSDGEQSAAATKADADAAAPEGDSGIDLRIVDGAALVTSVRPGSSADQLGVRPGWIVQEVGGIEAGPRIAAIAEVFPDASYLGLTQARSILSGLDGPQGRTVKAVLLDGSDQRRELELTFGPPRGKLVKLGHMPGHPVWVESRRLPSGVGYVAFNIFLDPGMVMAGVAEAMQEFGSAPGVIIDLRGNPGGIGAMSTGLAGWFVQERGRQLGVMKSRGTELKFVVNPRGRTYAGPVAVLIDELSASTTEIFAGGMQDLGRARLFGQRTAGAALPSQIERLPNGDGFQFAIADYISTGGARLEGIGVTPDEVVLPNREALLAGRDPVIEAAERWIAASGPQSMQ